MSAQLQLFEARQNDDRWTVRVSHRARRLSVRVYPGGRVEIVAPRGVSAAVVQRFVGVHRHWIDRRIQDLSTDGAREDLRPESVDLRAIGYRYIVRYEASASPRICIDTHDADRSIVVSGPIEDEHRVSERLREWLMERAAHSLGAALARTAQHCGFSYRRLQVRRQRTRWGSCSVTGTISLNACVLFLEPEVMRYLLIHELSHTKHMNHSKRFWSLVATHEPDYRRLDRELTGGWRRVPAWVFG